MDPLSRFWVVAIEHIHEVVGFRPEAGSGPLPGSHMYPEPNYRVKVNIYLTGVQLFNRHVQYLDDLGLSDFLNFNSNSESESTELDSKNPGITEPVNIPNRQQSSSVPFDFLVYVPAGMVVVGVIMSTGGSYGPYLLGVQILTAALAAPF